VTARPVLLQVAARVADLRDHSAQQPHLERARLCVRHYLACVVDARDLPWCRAVSAMALAGDPVAGSGATIIGASARVAVDDAVFVNAVLGQSALAEDLHEPSLTHPGSIVIPAALAAAEQAGASGQQLLNAVVAGYDVMCGIGTVLKTPSFAQRGFRPSGVFGPLGAAAATSAVLGLDEPAVASALAIAGNAGAGLREWAHVGTTDVYMQNGMAARNGMLAARLAASGITGPLSVLDGSAGMGRAFSGDEPDWHAAGEAFATRHALDEVTFKRYPACSGVQASVHAAVQLRQRIMLPTAAIRSVTVFTHQHGVTNPGCDNPGPFTGIGHAQMSNQLGVALALTGGAPDLDGYSRHHLPAVSALAQKVVLEEDPAYTARYPQESCARVEVTCADGQVLTESVDGVMGLDAAEVVRAAERSFQTRFGSARAAEISEALNALGRLAAVEDLLKLLREP
jgi:2-methylcitrate dehydratase PrpD